MKNSSVAANLYKYRLPFFLFVGLVIAAGIVAAPIYSVRASLFRGGVQPTVSPSRLVSPSVPLRRDTDAKSWLKRLTSLSFAGETVELFAADCATAKTAFTLGETVCAKTNGVDVTTNPGNYYMNWIDSQLNQTNGGTITQNPQFFLFVPPTSGTWKATIGSVSPADSSIVGNPPIFTVSDAPGISTYDSSCATPKTVFSLGQTVCAKAFATGGATARRRVVWIDPSGNARQVDDVTTDPQSFSFAVPSTQTSVVGGQTVDNRGQWKVNIISLRSSVVATATFAVTDPAFPSADLQAVKFSEGSTVSAGSNTKFIVSVFNNGPDAAVNAKVSDPLPASTTFFNISQVSGPTFTCTTPNIGSAGTVQCSIASLPRATTAQFELTVQVNTGTPNNTLITNTATVSSDTGDPSSDNNSSSASVTVSGGGGGGGTCTLTCPLDVNVQSNTTDPNNPNQPGAVVHYDAPTTDGTCGTITFSHCNDCFFPQGVTVVSVSETTGESCQFNVTVSAASNAPTITCPSNKEVDAQGNCSVVINDVGTATATGGANVTIFATRSDGKPMYNCDSNGQNCVRQNPDYAFAGGVTTITWTATSHNAAGEETGNSSCTQTITVNNASEDTTAPVITCPANITRSNDSGQCSAVINVGTATATDNCDGNPEIVGTRSDNQPLDAPYPKGTTTITWTATDASGNSSSCSQTVTVNDTEPPAITCPANITTGNDPGSCSATVSPGTATASDNCGNPTVTGTRSDNQSLSSPYPKGTTTITWTATDSSGNSTSCTQTVTVNDTEPPTISCPANITKNNDPGVCGAVVTYTTPVGSDNCPGATTAQTAGLPSGSTFPVGTTTNTFTVTDASGNATSCSFTVTVNDVEPPVITCPSSQTLEPTCPSGAIANWTAPVGTDNCPGAVTTRTAGPAPGSVFPIGTTTVTYTVNDAHGNSTSCSFTVTVKTVLQTLDDLRASVAANTQLNGTQRNGLLAKLDAAKQLIQSGSQNGACAKLSDFVNSTQNFIDHGDLSATTGNAWISTANHIRNALGCTNNPCS